MQSSVNCPQCESKGRKVGRTTLTSLLRSDAKATINDVPLRFCRTPNCDVVYFNEDHSSVWQTDALTVTVFQKSTDPDRFVCHCFEHTVANIESEVADFGSSDVAQRIGEKCKAGLDDCERNNPQGTCCLGNVRQVVKSALETNGVLNEGQHLATRYGSETVQATCCSNEEK